MIIKFRVDWRQLMTDLDGCKIAFLAIRYLSGSISYDTSTWQDIRGETQRLKRSCDGFPSAPSGGYLVVGELANPYYGVIWLTIVCTGDHSRLVMILYAPGSIYDDIVKEDLAAGTVIVADQDNEPYSGASAGILGPSSLSCRGLLPLSNSTFCNTTEVALNVK